MLGADLVIGLANRALARLLRTYLAASHLDSDNNHIINSFSNKIAR